MVLTFTKNGMRFVTTFTLNRWPGQRSHSAGIMASFLLRVVQAGARAHLVLQIWHDRSLCWQLMLPLTSPRWLRSTMPHLRAASPELGPHDRASCQACDFAVFRAVKRCLQVSTNSHEGPQPCILRC